MNMAECEMQKVQGHSEVPPPFPRHAQRPPFIVFDPNHDARFEAMRKHSKSAQVLRRHEDLRKRCEKEVRTYERWQKLAASELRQSQARYMNKLRKLKLSLARHYIQRKTENLAGNKQPKESEPVVNSVPHYIRVRKNSVPGGEDEDTEKTEDTPPEEGGSQGSNNEDICEPVASSNKKARPISQLGSREASPISLAARFENLRLTSSSVPLSTRMQTTQSPRTPRVYHQSPRMLLNGQPSHRMLGIDQPSQRYKNNGNQRGVSDEQKSPRGFKGGPKSPRIIGFGEGSARAIKLSPNSSNLVGLSLRSPRLEQVPPVFPKIAFTSPVNSPRMEHLSSLRLSGTSENRCDCIDNRRNSGRQEDIQFVELTDLRDPVETARLLQSRSRQRYPQNKKKAVTFVI